MDPYAVSVLTWLLVPGGRSPSPAGFANLSPDIDALLAGRLWLTLRASNGEVGALARADRLLLLPVSSRGGVTVVEPLGEASLRRDFLVADLGGQHVHSLRPSGTIATPARVGGERPGSRGQPRKRALRHTTVEA